MLTHGVPWQLAVTHLMISLLSFVGSIIACVIVAWIGWHFTISCIFLLIGFIIMVGTLPLLLNLSRSFFLIGFLMLMTLVASGLISFAFHYMHGGLIDGTGITNHDFKDCLYFSVTTFTTLGYGDLKPSKYLQFATSIQALSGVMFIAVFASFIWLWCQENIIPKEMAFFDGNRRHKKDICVHRMRIRTIFGKDRELKDYLLPLRPDFAYRYDNARQEWVEHGTSVDVPDGTLVLTPEKEDEQDAT